MSNTKALPLGALTDRIRSSQEWVANIGDAEAFSNGMVSISAGDQSMCVVLPKFNDWRQFHQATRRPSSSCRTRIIAGCPPLTM